MRLSQLNLLYLLGSFALIALGLLLLAIPQTRLKSTLTELLA